LQDIKNAGTNTYPRAGFLPTQPFPVLFQKQLTALSFNFFTTTQKNCSSGAITIIIENKSNGIKFFGIPQMPLCQSTK
jgi:hypothetical protein